MNKDSRVALVMAFAADLDLAADRIRRRAHGQGTEGGHRSGTGRASTGRNRER